MYTNPLYNIKLIIYNFETGSLLNTPLSNSLNIIINIILKSSIIRLSITYWIQDFFQQNQIDQLRYLYIGGPVWAQTQEPEKIQKDYLLLLIRILFSGRATVLIF